jgi:hypothetical protein
MTRKRKLFAQVIVLLTSVLFLITCASGSNFSGKQLHFNKKGPALWDYTETPRNIKAYLRPIARGLLSGNEGLYSFTPSVASRLSKATLIELKYTRERHFLRVTWSK